MKRSRIILLIIFAVAVVFASVSVGIDASSLYAGMGFMAIGALNIAFKKYRRRPLFEKKLTALEEKSREQMLVWGNAVLILGGLIILLRTLAYT